MSNRSNGKPPSGANDSNLSLVEAISNLSNLADLRIDPDKAERGGELLQGLEPLEQALVNEALHALRGSGGSPVDAVRETFQAILSFATDFYRKQYSQLSKPQVRRNFRSLLAMVGEAGIKLNRCTGVFHTAQRTSDLAEYRAIEDFYRNKLAKPLGDQNPAALENLARAELGDGLTGHGLSLHIRAAEDLQRLLDDSDYELFFLKKEDGQPFFSPALLRNLRVIHQLSGSLPESVEADPLLALKELSDLEAHNRARHALEAGHDFWAFIAKHAAQQTESPLFRLLYQGMLALMLAGNSRNLLAALPIKSSIQYFRDFLNLFAMALASEEYKEVLNSISPNPLQAQLLGLIGELAQSLFNFSAPSAIIGPYINKLIKSGSSQLDQHEHELAWQLLNEARAISTVLKRYPSGPLLRMLDFISAEEIPDCFEPLMQDNLPYRMWSIEHDGKSTEVMRVPSPTAQESITKAHPNPIFLAFLSTYVKAAGAKRHLLINIQDRTSFRDRARCLALEELPRYAEYLPHLTVVTLPRYGDFYFQCGVYQEDCSAEELLQQYAEQVLAGEDFGYYFPPGLKTGMHERLSVLSKDILKKHCPRTGPLSRNERIVLIDIFFNELTLDLIKRITPDSVSFTDKDGCDAAACTNTLFYIFYHWKQNSHWSPPNADLLHTMLFGPALTIRERLVQAPELARLAQTLYFLQTGRITEVDIDSIIA